MVTKSASKTRSKKCKATKSAPASKRYRSKKTSRCRTRGRKYPSASKRRRSKSGTRKRRSYGHGTTAPRSHSMCSGKTRPDCYSNPNCLWAKTYCRNRAGVDRWTDNAYGDSDLLRYEGPMNRPDGYLEPNGPNERPPGFMERTEMDNPTLPRNQFLDNYIPAPTV